MTFVVAEIMFKIAMITSSVAKVTLVVAEITLYIDIAHNCEIHTIFLSPKKSPHILRLAKKECNMFTLITLIIFKIPT